VYSPVHYGWYVFCPTRDPECLVFTVGLVGNMRDPRAVCIPAHYGWYLTCPNVYIAEDAVQYLTGVKLILAY
jgi:hypothetical protein